MTFLSRASGTKSSQPKPRKEYINAPGSAGKGVSKHTGIRGGIKASQARQHHGHNVLESNLELDTNIEDVYIHPLEKELVLDEDIEKPSLTHDEALSNAPKASDGKFIVPPSLE